MTETLSDKIWSVQKFEKIDKLAGVTLAGKSGDKLT